MGVCRHEGFLALASLMLEQERGGTHVEIISECSANVLRRSLWEREQQIFGHWPGIRSHSVFQPTVPLRATRAKLKIIGGHSKTKLETCLLFGSFCGL